MSDGDRSQKFRNRRVAEPRGVPQAEEKRSWWSRVLGPVLGQGRRRRPARQLAPTVLDAPSGGNAGRRSPPLGADSQPSGQNLTGAAAPRLPTFDQAGRPQIPPLRVTGTPLTLPRQRAGGYPSGPAGQKRPGFEPGAKNRRQSGTSVPRRSPSSRPAAPPRRPLPADAIPGITFQRQSGSSQSGPFKARSSQAGPSQTVGRSRPVRTADRPLGQRPPTRRAKAARPPQSRQMQAMVYALRLLILSVGVGVLAGTLLSVWDPASRLTAGNSQQLVAASPSPSPDALSQVTASGSEIQPLKAAIQALAFKTPQLAPGVFLLDLNTKAYVDLGGGTLFSAASTIKLPILIAFFQDVDAGKIRLEEMLTLSQTAIAKEAGDLQYQPVGTQIPALETAMRMITISDNTATNMLIERLGGKAALTARFQSWGLTATVLNNFLADVEGTNTTTAKEMVWLLAQINQGQLVSMTSRDRILDIMRQTQSTGLLPSGLGAGAKIAHKTGTLGLVLADVGVVDLPNGARYAIAVLVKRPFQDEAAAELIRQISKATYDYFTPPPSSLSPAPLPSPLAPNPGGSPGSTAPGPSAPNGPTSPR